MPFQRNRRTTLNSCVNDWPAHHCIGLQQHQATFARTTLNRRWVSRYRVLCISCYFCIWGPAPIWVRRCKLHFPRYRLVKVSWKSVQPFPRMVVSYFLRTEKAEKKTKKNKETSVKHIRIHLIGGCVNKIRAEPSLRHIQTHDTFEIYKNTVVIQFTKCWLCYSECSQCSQPALIRELTTNFLIASCGSLFHILNQQYRLQFWDIVWLQIRAASFPNNGAILKKLGCFCSYRAMHLSAYARSWDRMSSVCLSVCLWRWWAVIAYVGNLGN